MEGAGRWRVSVSGKAKDLLAAVGRSLAKPRAGGGGQGENEAFGDAQVVRYEGISMLALEHVARRIERGDVPVEVVVAKRDLAGGEVAKGTVMEVVGKGKGMVPYREELVELGSGDARPLKPEEWSIENVCAFFVLPLTRDTGVFYLDLVDPSEVGKRFQGSFVSQARRTNFSGLVQGLRRQFQGQDASNVFVWLDIFSANQPLLTRRDDKLQARMEALTFGLHRAIDRFDQTVIYWDDLFDPVPLTRAWCVWELYGAVKGDHDVQIVFDDAGHSAVEDALFQGPVSPTQNSKDLFELLNRLTPRSMDCHSPEDLRMITKAVEQLPGGFGALKGAVTRNLTRWLVFQVEGVVKRFEDVDDDLEVAWMLVRAGNFLRQAVGELKAASSYLKRARTIFEAMGDQAGLATALDAIGNVLLDERRYAQAEQQYQDALELRRKELGPDHHQVGETINNLGVALLNEGRFDEALETFDQAKAIYGGDSDSRQVELASTLNNIAIAMRKKGDLLGARRNYEEALAIKRAELGARHVEVALSLYNLSLLAQEQGDLSTALDFAQQALAIFVEVVGAEHDHTQHAEGQVRFLTQKLNSQK
ncbi:Nephrocystin-3 [Durusdinium trenchii]|uniref:Nephrocystin-3 n=1 Tax=Durusdinium trenchii TaxID=1381693 RepID=A0ABP0MJK7_9DINO